MTRNTDAEYSALKSPILDVEEQHMLMRLALREARAAMTNGEIPIGAVVALKSTRGLEILSAAHNQNIQTHRRIAHAELIALGAATDTLLERAPPNRRNENSAPPLDTDGVVLVATLEPCIMCFSAAILSGVSMIIFALPSPSDAGPDRVQMVSKGHARNPTVVGGVLVSESRHLFEEWRLANAPNARHWNFVSDLLRVNSQIHN